jgi:zinc/manganese transport system substrate-binding protein
MRCRSRSPRCLRLALAAVFATIAAAVAGCAGSTTPTTTGHGPIAVVGAESQYANVIAQVGGAFVTATAVQSNPNTDPHSFEASPSVARTVAGARLVVQNGLGYDTFMERVESASPSAGRRVIDVQKLLGLPDSTANPHLWYSPRTMPAVARAVAGDLSAIAPAHAAYFRANAAAFERSLIPWDRAIARFAAEHPGTPVASTEPVGDYMLEAADARNLTPVGLQADIMNGVDPAPQAVTLQEGLFADHRVKVLAYNQQVTDSLTQSFLEAATRNGVPVVGVYETMPAGYDYQSWMLAEMQAVSRAVERGQSTRRL